MGLQMLLGNALAPINVALTVEHCTVPWNVIMGKKNIGVALTVKTPTVFISFLMDALTLAVMGLFRRAQVQMGRMNVWNRIF